MQDLIRFIGETGNLRKRALFEATRFQMEDCFKTTAEKEKLDQVIIDKRAEQEAFVQASEAMRREQSAASQEVEVKREEITNLQQELAQTDQDKSKSVQYKNVCSELET